MRRHLLLIFLYAQIAFLAVAQEPRDPAADTYFAANALYNRKLYALAAEEFREFLAKNGGHEKAAQARLGLALSVYGEGKFAEAEPLLGALADTEKEALLLQAQCWLKLGKTAEATEGFSKARGRAGGDAAFETRALSGLVEALSAKQDWAAAAERAAELIGRTPDKSAAQMRARYQRGIALYQNEKFREAGDELGRVIDALNPSENPYFGQAALLAGEALRRAGDPDGAARRFEQAAKDGPAKDAAEALYRLAHLLFEQKRYDDVIRTGEKLKQEHKESPLGPQAALFTGRAAFEKKDYGRVKSELEPLVADSELGAEAAYWLGRSLVEQKQSNEAEKVWTNAIGKFPTDPRTPDLEFERAVVWMENERAAYAADVFERQASLGDAFPRSQEALRLATLTRFRLGDYAKTLTLSEKFAGNDHPDIAYIRADSLFRLGRFGESREALTAFVELHRDSPNRDDALILLAAAAEKESDPAKAIAALDQLVREHGDSVRLAEALNSLGRLRFASGDAGAARAVLERLARDFSDAPERATGDYTLGFVALGEGKTDEAARWFGGVADRFPKHELAPDSRLQQAVALLGKDGKGDAGPGALERFLTDYPKDERAADALFRLASARFERGEWQAAAQRYSELMERFPDSEFHARALYRVAWSMRELDDTGKAAESYRRLLSERADDPLAPVAALELAELADDDAEAIALLDQWIPKLPADDVALRERAYIRLANARMAQGDILAAAKAFEAAGDGDLAKLGAGEARLRLKEFAKAAELLGGVGDGALKTRALLRLGEARALMDDWDASSEAYRAALEKGAEGMLARQSKFGIAWAAENKGEREKAVELYRELVAAGERDEVAARSQFQIGECLFAAGDYDAAIKGFILVDTGHAFPAWRARAILEIGRALERKGDLEAAAEHYREVRERFPDSDAEPVAKDLLDALGGN